MGWVVDQNEEPHPKDAKNGPQSHQQMIVSHHHTNRAPRCIGDTARTTRNTRYRFWQGRGKGASWFAGPASVDSRSIVRAPRERPARLDSVVPPDRGKAGSRVRVVLPGNVPPSMTLVTPLYRFRWQVELLFKEWKSYTNLHKFSTVLSVNSHSVSASRFAWLSSRLRDEGNVGDDAARSCRGARSSPRCRLPEGVLLEWPSSVSHARSTARVR
jgi:hypothetical protein